MASPPKLQTPPGTPSGKKQKLTPVKAEATSSKGPTTPIKDVEVCLSFQLGSSSCSCTWRSSSAFCLWAETRCSAYSSASCCSLIALCYAHSSSTSGLACGRGDGTGRWCGCMFYSALSDSSESLRIHFLHSSYLVERSQALLLRQREAEGHDPREQLRHASYMRSANRVR